MALAPAWWLGVGAVLGFGIVGLLTIGWVLVPLGVLMVVIGLRTPRLRTTAAYLTMVGASAAPFAIAWLNRHGPGTVCSTRGSEQSCIDEWTPWPFLAVAGLMVAAGIVLTLRGRRAAERDR